eukprot:jgi/Mesvir1/163/Mv13522-RA.1
MRLLHFLYNSSALPADDDAKCTIGSSCRELTLVRFFTQLLSWSAGRSKAECSGKTCGTDGSAPDQDTPRQCPDAFPLAEVDPSRPATPAAFETKKRLQAPQLVDIEHLLKAVDGMKLPAAASTAIGDAVRESVVVAMAAAGASDSGHVTSSDEHSCHCDAAEEQRQPGTQLIKLNSYLAEDPEIAQWLETTLGVRS